MQATTTPVEPRNKTIAEAARDLRKGERWLRDWLKRHPCDQKGEPFYRLAGRTLKGGFFDKPIYRIIAMTVLNAAAPLNGLAELLGTMREKIERLTAEMQIANGRLRAALDDANAMCRSAYQIAERRETNWIAFLKQLSESLERQHKIRHAGSGSETASPGQGEANGYNPVRIPAAWI